MTGEQSVEVIVRTVADRNSSSVHLADGILCIEDKTWKCNEAVEDTALFTRFFVFYIIK